MTDEKTEAHISKTVYTYDAAGRMNARTWARTVGGQPLTTNYTYNLAGDMRLIDYSDATPDAVGRGQL